MRDFPVSIDHSDNPELKEAVIEQMSFWAESMPHHDLQDFGNAVTIRKIDYLPSCVLKLSTQYESRLIRRKRRPHKNESIPEKTVFSEDDIDRWNMSLYSHDGFAEGEHEFTVSGSEEVIQCGTCTGMGKVECHHCDGAGRSVCGKCHGDGNIRCHSCSGKGKTTCSSCSGNGKKTCSLCGGRGQRQQTRHVETGRDFDNTVPVQVWENCGSCHGSGNHTCSTCGGRKTVDCRTCGSTGQITCATCKGQGEVVCQQCKGEGSLTCSSCRGSGAEVEYFTVTQRFSPVSSTLNLHENEILENFPDFSPDFNDADDEMIVHLDAEVLSREDLDDSPVESSYKTLFDDHSTNAPYGEMGSTAFIRQQQALVGNINVFRIQYNFEETSYEMLFYGKEMKAHAPESPFTELAEEYKESAEKALKRWRIGAGMDLLDRAESLDREQTLKDIPQVRDKLKRRMLVHYQVGAYSGIAAAAALGIFILLHYFTTPGVFLPGFKTFVANNPLINERYALLLSGLFVLPFPFLRRQLLDLNYTTYGYAVYSDILRILLGFLTGVGLSLALFLMVYLMDLTGVGMVVNSLINGLLSYII